MGVLSRIGHYPSGPKVALHDMEPYLRICRRKLRYLYVHAAHFEFKRVTCWWLGHRRLRHWLHQRLCWRLCRLVIVPGWYVAARLLHPFANLFANPRVKNCGHNSAIFSTHSSSITSGSPLSRLTARFRMRQWQSAGRK